MRPKSDPTIEMCLRVIFRTIATLAREELAAPRPSTKAPRATAAVYQDEIHARVKAPRAKGGLSMTPAAIYQRQRRANAKKKATKKSAPKNAEGAATDPAEAAF